MTDDLPESLDDNEILHYIGLLEALVAVLAIKAGMNPETAMSLALQQLAKTTGMDTMATDAIIQERWQGRDLRAGALVANTFPEPEQEDVATTLVAPPAIAEPPPDPGTMAERLARYRERQRQEGTGQEGTEEPESDVTQGDTV